jgi:hypothetical protein
MLPEAFLSVTPCWVRKSFERSDRHLALHEMEHSAMPFGLREFMVKCWKRHRDVPTKIDHLVDQAFSDLNAQKIHLKRRLKSSNIKPEKLDKVNLLLSDIDVVLKDPANACAGMIGIQARVDAAKEKVAMNAAQTEATISCYRALQKCGHLGSKGDANWKWADKNLPEKEMPETKRTRTTAPAHVQAATPVPARAELDEAIVVNDSVGEAPPISSLPAVQLGAPSKRKAADDPPPEVNTPDINWIQCTTCGKWRITPVGYPTSWPDMEVWKCANAVWMEGLACSKAEDYSPEEPLVEQHHCNQPKRSEFENVKLLKIPLPPDEDAWLRAECALRVCHVWDDGFCGKRVAAAGRDSSMREMIEDLLYFLEDKREYRGGDGRISYSSVKPRGHDTVGGRITIERTKEMAAEWCLELRSILSTLENQMPKLKPFKRDGMQVWCRDETWEVLAQIDKVCYILIDLDSDSNRPRYRVYGPKNCVACDNYPDANAALRPFKLADIPVRGAVLRGGHYACLHPIDKQPNFAGENALQTWA